MKKLYSLITVLYFNTLFSQTLVHHTTNYFGPNANPVPEFTHASIPEYTQLSTSADYYFGYGDQTVSNYTPIEIPLLSEKVSVKVWSTLLEYYSVDEKTASRRAMDEAEGIASGDFYFQTRIRILQESKTRPALILNTTLKTASGSDFNNRRFFNTAGYYFDMELGKSFRLQNSFIEELRLVADLGFFSWDVQTPNLNVQDDALMYGLKLIAKHQNLSWENTFSGYIGWIKRAEDYGDRPMVFSSRLNLRISETILHLQFQHGIRYFPYEQIRLGIQIPLRKLTPKL